MRPLLLLLALSSTASGQVVVNGNIRQVSSSQGNLRFQLSKVFDKSQFHPDCECDTFATLNYANGVVSGLSVKLDEGSKWFAVSPGQRFAYDTISTLPRLIDWPEPFGSVATGPDFYLGFRMKFGAEHYGWAHIDATGESPRMIGSAIAYSAAGIVVGTTTTIAPEPHSAALLLLALLQWATHRRAKRRRGRLAGHPLFASWVDAARSGLPVV